MRGIKFYVLLISILITTKSGYGTIYQAETATLYKAVTETKNAGYSGDSYINFDNETGSYLELIVSMASAGEQTVKIRFANGSTNMRPMEIELNEEVITSVNFEPTGGWTIWDTISFTASFNQGINTLKCTSTGSDGGPNIDYFDISGEQGNSYSLNLSVNGPGAIVLNPDQTTFFEAQEVSLTATANIDGKFVGWGGDTTGDQLSITIIMDSDKTITATFEQITVEVPEPDFSMIGYATQSGEGYTTTTGGEGGEIIYINSISQLQSWAASRQNNTTPEIAIIQGYLEAETTAEISIKHGKNISIFGDPNSEGGYAELKNVSIKIWDYDNVIVRNLKMHEVFYPNDDLTIDQCHHVWIDHCEFHSKIGAGIGVDTYDGLLDIKKGSHNVTVSWCYLHDHMKTMLIGHSDNNGSQDANLEVTVYHCWFSNTDGRNPSLRFGYIHYFNNYLENISDYGFAVRNGAHALIENNHFESVDIPIATDKFTGHGFACISGNIYTGSCSENDNQISDPVDCEYWDSNIPYDYTLEEINTVAQSIQLYAGVGVLESVITSSNKISKTQNELKLWPNPATSKLNLEYFMPTKGIISVEIYDINGIKIYSENEIIGSFGLNRYELNLPDITTGYYFIRLITPESISVSKFNIVK
ncbi:MAG: carbohydrate-binding protein [Mariniphaga sp.]|nr:carbohydrate-binding protein [Mariniphaga sp.]